MYQRNLTLLTDLYELTMMQGYFKEKDANETVIFDAFYRSNPDGNAFSICAGMGFHLSLKSKCRCRDRSGNGSL